jgi:hypothetical protein
MDERWAELFGSTMGQQLHEALRVAEFSGAEIEQFKQALKTRNFLAHNFFRERAEELLSFAGRNRLIDELKEMQGRFSDADALLEPRVDQYASRHGITLEVRQAEIEKMLAEHGD